MQNDGTITVGLPNNGKYACFSTDIATANKKIGDITNIDLTAGGTVDVTLDNLQIYSIFLNDSWKLI